ncbi:hypothetical protein NDU88_006152 [Pleurodeles waltl]|uniref:Uncharacterized protein n=1 Tax=Pleurodeles waltl TaxID=8319 RepID=A0AAV7MCG6_PLEWA|nr:hypothetical protein NDU88_006152 [Pleurodeles waltl]
MDYGEVREVTTKARRNLNRRRNETTREKVWEHRHSQGGSGPRAGRKLRGDAQKPPRPRRGVAEQAGTDCVKQKKSYYDFVLFPVALPFPFAKRLQALGCI